MEQVKIFETYNSVESLEKKINEWLQEVGSRIEVVRATHINRTVNNVPALVIFYKKS